MHASPIRITPLLLLCALLAPASFARADTVAYWTLDETTPGDLIDLVGGLDLENGAGVLFGRPALADPVSNPDPAAGSQNTGAIDFGSSTAAYSRFSPALAITSSASLTFEGWLRVDAAPAFAGPSPQGVPGVQVVARVAGTRSLAEATGWVLTWNDDARLGFQLDGPSTPAYHFIASPSLPTLNDGQPHHFALVWDHDGGSNSGGLLRLFVDGIEQGGFDDVAAPATNDVFVLGSSFAPGLEAFGGVLDEIRVSDAPLTPGEFLNAFVPDQTQVQIVSNLDTNNLGHTGSSTEWIATEFRTDDQAWLLRAIEVDLENFIPGAPIQASFHLFADGGNVPSSLIASFDPFEGPNVAFEHVEYSGPPLLLEPDTSYWIALEPVNGPTTLWSLGQATPIGLTGPGSMTQPHTLESTDPFGPWAVGTPSQRQRVRVLGTPIPPVPDGLFVDWSQYASWHPDNTVDITAFTLRQGVTMRNVANTGLTVTLLADSFNNIPSPDRNGANLRLQDNPSAVNPAITLTFENGSADVIVTDINSLRYDVRTISNSDGAGMAIRQLTDNGGDLMLVNGAGVPVLGLPVAVGSSAMVSEPDTTPGSTYLVEIPGARGFRWHTNSTWPFFGSTTATLELRLANVQIDADPVPVLPPLGLGLLGAGAAGLLARALRRTRRTRVW